MLMLYFDYFIIEYVLTVLQLNLTTSICCSLGSEEIMETQLTEFTNKVITLGRLTVLPRVLVFDSKRHIRTFLMEILEELGFVSCGCAQVGELDAVLDAQRPDLVVFGLSASGIDACEMLNLLANKEFGGNVLLLGSGSSPVVSVVNKLGEERGLAMLPILATPFCAKNLHDSVATLLPVEAPPNPQIDVAEALI
jgi:CheY-like chemotaxis protein